jgi:signal transduction histidine kinase
MPKIAGALDIYRADVYNAHRDILQSTVRDVVIGIVGLVVLSTLVGATTFAVVRTMIRSLDRLEAGSEALGRGDLLHRIDLGSRDELGRLAASFNRMAEDLDRITVSREELLRYQKRLKRLAEKLEQTEESERRKVARILHDNVGQNLSLSSMRLSVLRDGAPSPEAAAELDEIIAMVDGAIRETRDLTFDLSPPVLHELGLPAAVDWLAEQTRERHGFEVQTRFPEDFPRLDENLRVLLFQAVRELLTNVLKHAEAPSASVTGQREEQTCTVTVEDGGRGFQAGNPSPPEGGGFGLFSLRERLSFQGGRLEMESEPGRGTRACVVVPLKPAEET